ncbi:hypothetical protein CTI12_AA522780 [Artemisia annua]|uniref:SWIM-type domain-containing protein n=1 Tax=Artemisia annua TaxID=35608 RepID=A0A2U1L7C0_ARTAN|nr:hypothetical protein CTI12_AA522780 [Artemisia annua]
MTENEDFNTISQIDVVNNEMSSGFETGRVQANRNLHTPHVAAKLAASTTKASAHTMRSFNRERGIFEETTQTGKNVQVVNLEKQTCTCGKWENNKYPCFHVLSACAFLSLNSSQYVQRYYSIVEYSAT